MLAKIFYPDGTGCHCPNFVSSIFVDYHRLMTLSKAAINILRQLADLVEQINDSDFSRPSHALSKSTIGQHIRHTLEFFLCLESGFDRGVINYDRRSHDKLIESDKVLALAAIERGIQFVSGLQPNRPLTLEVGYDTISEEYVSVETNSTRELVYNIEHAVHHMAIMKIGVREIAPYVTLPPDFGIAASTLRFQQVAGTVATKS